ncbi:MAG TPA: hypothetical protein VIJ20_05545, partial [Solirubrobacteraceae bacterium]
TGVFVPGGHYSSGWRIRATRGAYAGRAILSSTKGATFTLTYRGGDLAILGELSRAGGRARVTLDGRSRTISLRAARARPLTVLYRARLGPGRHRLTITVIKGMVALEGLAITSRRS